MIEFDSEVNNLNIAGTIVKPGSNEVIKLPVGRLPSDTRISIYADVFRSENPGPVVLLLGGVHGDEINGVEISRKLIERKYFEHLKRGTVIAIPLLNIFGFINFSREVPDGKDVNRSFPGNMGGSLASRIARTMTKKILPHVDIAIDCHTGGASRYNYPQIRYTAGDSNSFALAKAFSAPFILAKATIPKSLRRTTKGLGIPTLVYEAGESERLDGFSISKGIEGVQRVLNHLEMADFTLKPANETILCKKSHWIRSPYSGIFMWTQQSGTFVRKNEPIGVIKDPFGKKSINVIADREGYIVGHNNASVVNQGDALFHLGLEFEKV